MLNTLIELLKVEDEKIIKKYCQKGAYIDEQGKIVHGVCRAVSIEEILNDIHLRDSLILEAIRGDK